MSHELTVLYERYRHDDELQGESNSISNQKAVLEDYAEKNGFMGIRHFTDDGIWGTTFEREGLQAMLAEIEKGNIGTIIVKVFITESDVMKGNQPIYPVERYVAIGENKVLFGDGAHILYVNGKYRGNDEIGKLMYDFSCTNPDDMNYEALAKKARYFKQDEKGVAAMCKIMEGMSNNIHTSP